MLESNAKKSTEAPMVQREAFSYSHGVHIHEIFDIFSFLWSGFQSKSKLVIKRKYQKVLRANSWVAKSCCNLTVFIRGMKHPVLRLPMPPHLKDLAETNRKGVRILKAFLSSLLFFYVWNPHLNLDFLSHFPKRSSLKAMVVIWHYCHFQPPWIHFWANQ